MQTLVECPRCHKVWRLPEGCFERECDCHLYCEDGLEPKDCQLIDPNALQGHTYIAAGGGYVWNGQYGYPAGMHTGGNSEDEDVPNRDKFCLTHKRWCYKDIVYLEVDTERWKQTKRLTPKYRDIQK